MKHAFYLSILVLMSCGRKLNNNIHVFHTGKASDYQDNVMQVALNKLKNKNQTIIIHPGKYLVSKMFIINQPNITLQFLTGAEILYTSNTDCGIVINANNCKIENGCFNGNGQSSNDFYKGFGILLCGVDSCTIKNCTFNAISGNTILFLPNAKNKGCSYNKIEGNKITNPVFDINFKGDESAILLGYSGKGYSHDNNVITNNQIDGNNLVDVGIGIIGQDRKSVV